MKRTLENKDVKITTQDKLESNFNLGKSRGGHTKVTYVEYEDKNTGNISGTVTDDIEEVKEFIGEIFTNG